MSIFKSFFKKSEPASDFDEINRTYYGEDMNLDQNDTSDNEYGYKDSADSDVSVVLSGDPSKEEPLMKRTFTPSSCQDGAEIVDAFKDGRVVVIYIEELDRPNFMRLFDYLMGAIQALDGELLRPDRETAILLPYGVDSDEISVDELEEEIVGDDADEEDIEDEDNGELD